MVVVRHRAIAFLFVLTGVATLAPAALTGPGQEDTSTQMGPPGLTAEEIVVRLEERNLKREAQLGSYTVRRVYYVLNERTKRESRLEVEMTFQAPGHKQFKEISANGSKFLRKRLFDRLIAGEQEAMQPQQKRLSAISRENYGFALAGEELVNRRRHHVLEIVPKRKEKFLFEGKLWVDAEDLAIARIAGRPAKRLSFWVRKADFVRKYRKVADFWLPASDETITEVLFFGRSVFTIHYGDYHITRAPAPAGNGLQVGSQH